MCAWCITNPFKLPHKGSTEKYNSCILKWKERPPFWIFLEQQHHRQNSHSPVLFFPPPALAGPFWTQILMAGSGKCKVCPCPRLSISRVSCWGRHCRTEDPPADKQQWYSCILCSPGGLWCEPLPYKIARLKALCRRNTNLIYICFTVEFLCINVQYIDIYCQNSCFINMELFCFLSLCQFPTNTENG